jgi:hypothetical protein
LFSFFFGRMQGLVGRVDSISDSRVIRIVLSLERAAGRQAGSGQAGGVGGKGISSAE